MSRPAIVNPYVKYKYKELRDIFTNIDTYILVHFPYISVISKKRPILNDCQLQNVPQPTRHSTPHMYDIIIYNCKKRKYACACESSDERMFCALFCMSFHLRFACARSSHDHLTLFTHTQITMYTRTAHAQ